MITPELSSRIERLIIPALKQTLQMVGFSSFFSVVFGIILGVTLYLTKKDGLKPIPILSFLIGGIINIGRSIPFIILIFIFFPITRLLVGSGIGTRAASVSLTFAAIPFAARIMEATFNEVDVGVIEATKAMGATNLQILLKVVIPESIQSIISNITIIIINIIGYSAMAGSIGGGGLGDVAISYGFQRNETEVMVITILLLVIFVQIIQFIGNLFSKNIVEMLKNIRAFVRKRI